MAKRHMEEQDSWLALRITSLLMSANIDDKTKDMALRIVALGFVAGLRSMTPFALLQRTRERDPEPTNDLERFLDSTALQTITTLLATGEVLGDKLPFIPSRTSKGSLIARISIGGLAGMSLARRYQQPLVLGAALGAVGAGVGSYAGYYSRSVIQNVTGIPGWILGLVEDAIALRLGTLAIEQD